MKFDRVIKLEPIELAEIKGHAKILITAKNTGTREDAAIEDSRINDLQNYVSKLVQTAFDWGFEEGHRTNNKKE